MEVHRSYTTIIVPDTGPKISIKGNSDAEQIVMEVGEAVIYMDGEGAYTISDIFNHAARIAKSKQKKLELEA